MNFHTKFRFIMNQNNPLPYKVTTHVHDCYELVYYITGSGISKINNAEHPYTDNTFCIIPPHTKHSEYAITETDLIYIGFEYDDGAGKLPVCLIKDKDDRILEIMKKVKNEVHKRNTLYEEMLEIYPYLLVIELIRLLSEYKLLWSKSEYQSQSQDREFLDYAVDFIMSNYSKSINLYALADSIGYSYHHFRHIFKETYGFSPNEFIINTRINKAKDMLCNTNKSVKSISRSCGFNSCSHFIATFRKKFGVSPSKYRKTAGKYPESYSYLD